MDQTVTYIVRLKRAARVGAWKLAGAGCFALAAALAVALLSYSRADDAFGVASNFARANWLGATGAWSASLLASTFGLASLLVVWILAIAGIAIIVPRLLHRAFPELLSFTVIGALLLLLPLANVGLGGRLGEVFALAISALPMWAGAVISLLCLVGAIVFLWFGLNFNDTHWEKIRRKLFNKLDPVVKPQGDVERASAPVPEPQHVPMKPREPKKESAYRLPPLSLLNPAPRDNTTVNDELNRKKASMLEQILGQFGVDGKITSYKTGPVITLFEMEAGRGVKTSRITALSDDIAREMSALSARISLIPGTNKIGVDLPNLHRKMVSLRTQFESAEFMEADGTLPISLGSDAQGKPVVVDLAKMPHLLIAGTTGSGKSVGVNGMILSLIYRYTPDEIKFIMIDPKMLEFAIYNHIPHLLIPVVTEAPKAVAALKWAVREMEERNRNMSALGAKNIESYNARASSNPGQKITRQVQTGFDPSTGEPMFEDKVIEVKPMPYIVVVVDEMADLMLVAGKDVEAAIARLAAMARAAGIHLILSTQRPSVDVITGTIKSNFPNRIAYRVASKIDSRTIINEQGAELMLGKGDMLYMAMGGALLRVHGAFVSEEEIERVVRFVRREGKPNYVHTITEAKPSDASAMSLLDKTVFKANADEDELYARAVQVIISSDRPSISFLQRQLGIGYNKSANLIERMEKAGVVSAPDSQGKRVVLGRK
jgi:S-DNA-T family DNA segregation ATPase FtsK/SpoIIIE